MAGIVLFLTIFTVSCKTCKCPAYSKIIEKNTSKQGYFAEETQNSNYLTKIQDCKKPS